MAADLNAIQTAVRALMTANVALTTVVPAARIFDAWPNAVKPTPNIAIGGGDAVPLHVQQGVIWLEDVAMAVEVRAASADSCRTVAGLVRNVFNGAALTVSGARVNGPVRITGDTGHLYEKETDLHRQILTIQFDLTPA